MGRSQKTKRVSWASDRNLCQVRLFSSEESPSLDADDDLAPPPGFEGIKAANPVPLIRWRCPPRFEVNAQWQVVAGEESKEVKDECHRVRTVLEAVYHRPASIPPNPFGLLAAEKNSMAIDKNTPVVSITPIEEADTSLYSTDPTNTRSKANDILAAITSLLPESDHENLVDRDLLVEILSNPKLVVRLVYEHIISVGMKKVANFDAQNLPPNLQNLTQPMYNNTVNRTEHFPSLFATSPMDGPMKKDVEYYKKLVQQHGRPEFGKSEPKVKKPCIYFNSLKGCRNGAACAFQHGGSTQRAHNGFAEVHSTKRVKLCGIN